MAAPQLDPRFKSDTVFNQINRQFITLKDSDMQEYSKHLKRVLTAFTIEMKKDVLFNACFTRISYVGSYYEGLKVGKPEEFDLNFIIKLPVNYGELTTKIVSNEPGYIKIQASKNVLPNLRKHPRWSGTYKKLDDWFDPHMYLDQKKFRYWFESVVIKALSSFEYTAKKRYILTIDETRYKLHHKKSGPALTLKIDIPNGHTVDVDLVPVLEFQSPLPPPFKNHKTKKQNWFAVSKPLEGKDSHILWRPSFYEREQELLKGVIKPVIRQMKKLRDTQNFKNIASYYIRTIFLNELVKQNFNSDFQKWPLTNLFFYMLKELYEVCNKGVLPCFWNSKANLFARISEKDMSNIRYRLKRIITKIDRKITDDQYVIAEFILTADELSQLKQLVGTEASLNTEAMDSASTVPTALEPAQSNNTLTMRVIVEYWFNLLTTADSVESRL